MACNLQCSSPNPLYRYLGQTPRWSSQVPQDNKPPKEQIHISSLQNVLHVFWCNPYNPDYYPHMAFGAESGFSEATYWVHGRGKTESMEVLIAQSPFSCQPPKFSQTSQLGFRESDLVLRPGRILFLQRQLGREWAPAPPSKLKKWTTFTLAFWYT